MKKSLVLIVLLVCSLFCGCATTVQSTVSTPIDTENKLSIVTTIYPIYDWTINIVGTNAEVSYLLDSGVDLHNFQPTADDIVKIKNADLFIYVGGESDEWVENLMANNIDTSTVECLNLMEVLKDNLVEEELVEGMRAEETEEIEDEIEYDEHIWLSLKNADIICAEITRVLSVLDKENATYYENNYDAYRQDLLSLDASYQQLFNTVENPILLFVDRFPFRYLVRDYGATYYAAFNGCSAETEASFETIEFLVNKIDELQLDCVYKLEGTDSNLADTITVMSERKPQILVLDSMQSISDTNNLSYLCVMKKNYITLKEGFGK